MRATSINIIQRKDNHQTMNRPQSNQSFFIMPTPNDKRSRNINKIGISPSSYNKYVHQKQSYKDLISSRNQNEKDLTLLTRTFYS